VLGLLAISAAHRPHMAYIRAVNAWWPKLVEAAPAARAALAERGVEERIAEAMAAARDRFADAGAITDEALAVAIGERLATQKDPAAALARLRADDLLLAQWCATGDHRAIAEFERVHRADVDAVLARFKRLSITGDELRQTLRIKLFVATSGRAPRISDYSGFGFLQNWLRVTALRALVDVARSERARKLEELLADDDMLGLPALGQDLAANVSREEVSRAIKQAFAHAVAALAPRQRNFLRHAHVDQLTLDQIAATYNIHRATVARTLAQARAELVSSTRDECAHILGVAPESLDSVVRAADSRIDLSLSRILRAPESDFAEGSQQ
jgi:RNA polymerase sigma-70 factor (ECF subfamily)